MEASLKVWAAMNPLHGSTILSRRNGDMKIKLLLATATVLLSLVPLSRISASQNDEANLDSSIETLRADLRADKVTIITDAMKFTDSESKIFWPIYRKYEADLAKVNDGRVALIKSYAEKYESMTDADAKALIDQSLDFESRRTGVKRKYAAEFQKAGLPALTVAKFLQLEHRLDLMMDLQIASRLPSLLNKPVGQTSSPSTGQ
jgi:hypothetical protein